MGLFEDRSNLLVRQFENKDGRRSWKKKDNLARSKFVEDCIRLVGMFERLNQFYDDDSDEWKTASGIKRTLAAIRIGEGKLWVQDVNSRDVKVFAEELKKNMSLLFLNIRSNEIGDEGARYLAHMLRENWTLLDLDIGYNAIRVEGARHFSDGLRQNSSLLYLTLYNNKIGDKGTRHLSDGLRENSTLLFLDVGRNDIGDEGARYLSDGLRENSTLLSLNVTRNYIGDEGARCLSDGLRENSTLSYLNISYNNIVNKELESEISDEINSRQSNLDERSFTECRLFLQSVFSIPTWTSVCTKDVYILDCDQLPYALWSEILAFLSDDAFTLKESFLVPDLRCGFLIPVCSFSPRETPLLSMIPCIEGHFCVDTWTRERLDRLEVYE